MRFKKVDFDDEMTMCTAMLSLLEFERHQKFLIAHGAVKVLMKLYMETYTLDCKTFYTNKETNAVLLTPAQSEKLLLVRTTISQRLWDLSVLPEFAGRYHPHSDAVREICRWLSSSRPDIQTCACSLLRNVASSEETSKELLHVLMKDEKKNPLLDLLRKPADDVVCQEALRLLRNLALPHANKRLLTMSFHVLDVLVPLYLNLRSAPVRYVAIGTLRQILLGSYISVVEFLFPRGNMSAPSTHLTGLLTTYHENEELTVRMEIARLIVDIWRVASKEANKQASIGITNHAIRQALAANFNIAVPIFAMISDSQNPSLVTEGWLGLTLVASSPKGADIVCTHLENDPTFQTFKDIIMMQKAGSPDQNNAIILSDRLIWHYVSNISFFRSCVAVFSQSADTY